MTSIKVFFLILITINFCYAVPNIHHLKHRFQGQQSNGQSSDPSTVIQTYVDHIKSTAGPKSTGKCARFVNRALEKAMGRFCRPVPACEYVNVLPKLGFSPISDSNYQVGDVVVFSCSDTHFCGHIAIYTDDSSKPWMSDFRQRNMMPWRAGLAGSSPQIFRYDGNNKDSSIMGTSNCANFQVDQSNFFKSCYSNQNYS
jgi:hypothetical protein